LRPPVRHPGSHPVLIALQSRLAALRQRELGIAARRLAEVEREHENVRKADISGVWEWWRNGREELQRDMMADVMRKRRRVDREKRTVEGGRREWICSSSVALSV
jgi:hypothetical protein